MIGEHFPKVSPPSRQSLKSYNAKFVMDKCARNKYGATLNYNRIDEKLVRHLQIDADYYELTLQFSKATVINIDFLLAEAIH